MADRYIGSTGNLYDPAQFSAEELDQAGPLLAVAVGLGLRRPGDKGA